MSKDFVPTENNFDFLRWFFAFSVVIYHLIVLTGNVSLKPVAKIVNGGTAVCGFFIISGFLITRSWVLKNEIKKYSTNRMRRLLPGYLSVVLISTIGLSLFSKLSLVDYFLNVETFKYLFANIMFVNFLHPSLPGIFESNSMNAVNGSLWTIKVEIMFYILVPIIVLIMTRMKKKLFINIFLAFVYLSTYIYRSLCHWIAIRYGISFFNELAHQLPGYFNYFSTGILLYTNFESIKNYEKKLIIPAVVFVILHYLIGTDYIFPLALGIIIFYIAFNFHKLNTFGKYGDFSYGTYIFHFPIIQLCIALNLITSKTSMNYFIPIIFTLLFSYASWHIIEKRFLKRRLNSNMKCNTD